MKPDTDTIPLIDLQKWMQGALFTPGLIAKGSAGLRVKPSSRLSAAQRLAIYQRSFIERLRVCMGEQFPALKYAIGEDVFDDLACQYIRDCPPQSYTLYDLGKRFASYLAETRPDKDLPNMQKESWIDFMIDLVTFERQIFEMFDAPGYEECEMAITDTPDEQLTLQPCLTLGAYQFSVARYYHDVKHKLEPPLPAAEATFVALVRKDFITQTLNLSPGQYRCLQLMQGGLNLPKALAVICDETTTAMDEVMDIWSAANGPRQNWIEAGVFAARPTNLT